MTKKIVIKVIDKNNNSEIKLAGSSANKAKIYSPVMISTELKKNKSRLTPEIKTSQEKNSKKTIEVKLDSIEAKKSLTTEHENLMPADEIIKKNHKVKIIIKHKFK